MKSWTYSHRSQIRALVWGALVLGVGTEAITSFDSGLKPRTLGVFAAVLGMALVAECAITLSRPNLRIKFSASQSELLRQVPELHLLIAEAPEVMLLGGTMKTLTDDSRVIEAINKSLQDGKHVRILLMHPRGTGIQSTARARQSGGKSVTADDLATEVKTSLNRMVDGCGVAVLDAIRLYSEHPTYSLFCFGSKFMLTIYSTGRGASSPALFLGQSEKTNEFIRGLRRGFDDLWRSPTTIPASGSLAPTSEDALRGPSAFRPSGQVDKWTSGGL